MALISSKEKSYVLFQGATSHRTDPRSIRDYPARSVQIFTSDTDLFSHVFGGFEHMLSLSNEQEG